MTIHEESTTDIQERLGQAANEAERAETRQTYAEAPRNQFEAARAWMEHPRVQAALTEKEVRSVLDESLRDLKYEIANTDNLTDKQWLKERQALLRSVVDKLS